MAPADMFKQPIPAALVASASLRFGDVALDRGDAYWLEGRPLDGGRNVIVRRSADGTIADATPAGTNVRTRVQEFGGAAYAVADGTICFSEFSDQRLYRLTPGGAVEAMTPPSTACRYADVTIDRGGRRAVSVREDHRGAGEAVTTLVLLPLDGPPSAGNIIASGYDFYSTPRFSPDGSRLAWLCWRHPQMPWDGSELWVAVVGANGHLDRARLVAGGERESIFQPGWSPGGVLHFVSDRTGWWNLYREQDGDVECVYAVDADCGRPQWALGTTTWAFIDERTLVMGVARDGRWTLEMLRGAGGANRLEPLECAEPGDLQPGDYLAADESQVVCVGASSTMTDAVVRVDVATSRAGALRVSGPRIDPSRLSRAETIHFPAGAGLLAHAFYYTPEPGEATADPPPLIVIGHGGPTGAARAGLNLEVQFWTSRGFALVDVNYGGSSGYGRAYRERINGRWGVVDVDDLVSAARYLVSLKLADSRRMIIRGRSAGGFTALAALTSYPDVFAAGASYYGIGDLERLATGTHKFESRYLDRLVGPYPECRELYRDRSPINHVDRLACPLIVFQGLDDKVVPPAQAEAIAAAVRAKGLPVELHTFPGEGHGFRKAETIVRCLEAEDAFYRRILG